MVKKITFETVAEVARKLPGVTEGLMFGKGAVKVNGKLLACRRISLRSRTQWRCRWTRKIARPCSRKPGNQPLEQRRTSGGKHCSSGCPRE